MELRSPIWSATPTPFLRDGSLDDAGLENLVRQHGKLGVRGIVSWRHLRRRAFPA